MESKPIMDSETGDFPGFIVSFMGHLARRPGYEGGSIHLFLHASWLMLKVPLKKKAAEFQNSSLLLFKSGPTQTAK